MAIAEVCSDSHTIEYILYTGGRIHFARFLELIYSGPVKRRSPSLRAVVAHACCNDRLLSEHERGPCGDTLPYVVGHHTAAALERSSSKAIRRRLRPAR